MQKSAGAQPTAYISDANTGGRNETMVCGGVADDGIDPGAASPPARFRWAANFARMKAAPALPYRAYDPSIVLPN